MAFQFEEYAFQNEDDVEWRAYGGDAGGTRYAPMTQINKENVGQLKPVWSYDTGENNDPEKKGASLPCQPIMVGGVLYGTTPKLKLFATEADTGKELWKFDPFENSFQNPTSHPIRGVVYWERGEDKRILYSVGPWLYAIDARTGTMIKSFGQNGVVDLHEGLGDSATLGYDVQDYSMKATTPGVIYNDLLIMGSALSEGGDAIPGHIRAFNVRTGQLAWVFRTIPLPGEYGYETWSKNAYKKLGAANCWAGMVVDEKRGMVFLGTGSPSVDFYGAERIGTNLFANCVIALNAKTGERVWHFQTVHHDLWDRDIPCPPNLITVTHQGRKVEAVAQATKDGYVFIFDRDTGAPLFPVQEVPVPTSPALPGEQPWPTQPMPSKPKPFANQVLTKDALTRRTPEAYAFTLDRFENSLTGSKYMPPSTQGTLYYGFAGGAEWGGAAVDPNGIFYINSSNMLWWLQMRQVNQQNMVQSEGEKLFNTSCSGCHALTAKDKSPATAQSYPSLENIGSRLTRQQINELIRTGRNRMPSFQHLSANERDSLLDFLLKTERKEQPTPSDDIHQVTRVHTPEGKLFPYSPPYVNNGNVQFLDPDGYPAIKAPWGTLNAIDMNTGEYLWQVPLGEYPELTKQGAKPTGSANIGGPLVTAGGLVFIAATSDEKIRAFDRKTGQILWEYTLPAGGFATPITYKIKGVQFVVIAAGGSRFGKKSGGQYMAFALP
ncbi:pyrroloquinoline quinone-dependent dehydrogenase [Dyadobacter jejuensis]|nr:pyrroloquinoline quinone-dependent dehydrogenase [Dyadobacter jejuensis]